MLAEALDRYDDLASRTAAYGQNADAFMTGTDHAAGTLEVTYMGRQGGLQGNWMHEDLTTGRWGAQRYEVRRQPFNHNNWFPISAFIARTAGI